MPARDERDEWDAFVAAHPSGHILQTSGWGELKSAFGWRAERVRVGESGALVLFRPLPFALGTLAYVPKGPLVNWHQPEPLAALLPALDTLCRRHRAAFLKIEPDIEEIPNPNLQSPISTYQLPVTNYLLPITLRGFRLSSHAIQPRRTTVVDITGDEQAILGRMKQKCRYNIGLAKKKGVTVGRASDLAAFNALMAETAARDGFGVHVPEYYRQAYELFHSRGMCELLMAEYQGLPLAALMVFALGRRAWYFYGASSHRERARMPTYLLQWEAMRWARSRGCAEYDLWGVPDEDEGTLEANFESRHDGLWGVYRFKRGFGGRVVRSAGAWDRVYNPAVYWLYKMRVNSGEAN